MNDTYDSPWKELLEHYFPQFLAFFFPRVWRDVDWAQGYESLDQELRKVVRESAVGDRRADKLMKVWRRNGEEQVVFMHVEVQGQYDADFAERMYVYNYRIYDRHARPVVSLAVLADERAGWRPDRFAFELWGCRMALQFPVVKLQDYNRRWADLEASDNVFAMAVMAHLKTGATRGDPQRRLRWKTRLVRRLYSGGYTRRDALELLRFVDWLLELPVELEEKLSATIERLEAEKKMRYVTSWERRAMQKGVEEGIQKGIQKGMQEGIQQGEASVLRRLLIRRFEDLPAWAEERLSRANRQEIEIWADRVLEARALEDVFA